MSATTTRHHGILAAMTRDTATEPGAPVAERRDSRRVCRMISVTLTAADRDKRCPCTLEDICPDGAFVRLPAGFDLMVGQRCEVTFAATVECTDLAAARLDGESCFATVVRTATLTAGPADSTTLLGAGLRFDQPLFL